VYDSGPGRDAAGAAGGSNAVRSRGDFFYLRHMDREKMAARLQDMLDELDGLTSLRSIRQLETVFGLYKIMVESLPNIRPFDDIKVRCASEFSDIEFDLELAKKSKPASKAESRFSEARGHIIDDITDLLREINGAS
jgi:hypothetical protein